MKCFDSTLITETKQFIFTVTNRDAKRQRNHITGVHVLKRGHQLGALFQKFGRKMTYLGAMATKLVAKLSPVFT